MFERFTESARQVIVLAQDEARVLKHNYIGTEHLLLGLLREEDSLAARALNSFGMTVEEVRAKVVRKVGEGGEVTIGQFPFKPVTKKVLEISLREALALGHNYVGSEHILLGLTRVSDGAAAPILLDFAADQESLRERILGMAEVRGAQAETPASGVATEWHDLAALISRLQQAKEALIERQQFQAAARLRDHQRRLELLVREIEADLAGLDPAIEPSPRAAEAARWEYDVKTLDGKSDTWAKQLAAWRTDGWELISVVSDGETRRAIVERRAV